MPNTKTKPLTDLEIRTGLKRLESSALMKASSAMKTGGAGWAYDLTCNFKLNVGPPPSEIAKAYGSADATAAVIRDLAVALFTKRLTANEAFRLGTSPEAMQLFEAECDEWNDPRGWRFTKDAAVTA
jgi:hypothetical protein